MHRMNTVEAYLDTLSEHEEIAMEIAASRLGSSFDICASIGFAEHCKACQGGADQPESTPAVLPSLA